MVEQYPAIVGGAVAILGAFLTPILAKRGIDASGAQAVAQGVCSIIAAVASILAVMFTHKRVTPVANPKLNDGTLLVPVAPALTQTTFATDTTMIVPTTTTSTAVAVVDATTLAANESQSAEDGAPPAH